MVKKLVNKGKLILYIFFYLILLAMTVKTKIIAINNLLSDIYQKEMRLSYLLTEIDFTKEDIQFIANKLLTETIDNFIATLQNTLLNFNDGQRLFYILSSIYGLDGNNPKTLHSIGNQLEITRERVRQLKEKAIKRLRATKNLSKWETNFKSETIELLKQNKNNNYSSAINEDIRPFKLQTKYSFLICQSESGCNYLTISSNQNGNPTASIIITQDTIQDFCNELIETMNLLGWQHNLKNRSINDIKQQYQKAYEKWTIEEEQVLVNKFEHGLSIKEIAAILERQPGAINSRLRKLGLK